MVRYGDVSNRDDSDMWNTRLLGLLWNKVRCVKNSLSMRIWNLNIRWAVYRVNMNTKMQVVTGPFAGMIVSSEHVFGAPIAKLLGTYEKELHPYLQKIIQSGVSKVMDIGGAEGYYAIGMALQESVKHVLVWESLGTGREIKKKLAQSNLVEGKIRINEECDEAALYEAIMHSSTNGFLIMDIEGAELELLSLRVCEALHSWKFIVEIHEFIIPGCREILLERFKKSHSVTIVRTRERVKEDYPMRAPLLISVKKWLMNEGRPGPMEWLVGMPLNS